MSTKRTISLESNVYHRPGCRYVKKIHRKNRLEALMPDLKYYGCRPCRCCNCMDYQYKEAAGLISRYEESGELEFKYIDGILYVKTNIGCWKLVYGRGQEDIVIYHRNTTSKPLDFEHPENEWYHRQTDIMHAGSIAKCLNYIVEHDRFREAEANGTPIINFKNERHRRSAEKSRRRAENKRMDSLFDLIETQLGSKAVSFC